MFPSLFETITYLHAKINVLGQESQVLDYKMQQYQLFPLIAAAFAFHFTGSRVCVASLCVCVCGITVCMCVWHHCVYVCVIITKCSNISCSRSSLLHSPSILLVCMCVESLCVCVVVITVCDITMRMRVCL